MRVIAGQYKGAKLRSFTGGAIRPTADRLRESIFNIIGPRIYGRRVLDLFAGTGAMGIEALSRGALHAVFIDNNPIALDLIRQNLDKVKASGQATVIRWNISRNLDCLHDRAKMDFVFIDPPYRKHLVKVTLDNLLASDIGFGAVVVEHEAKESIDNLPAGFILKDQRRYGKTLVSFLGAML